MTKPLGRQAIVIGASMGGLAAARVLADHYRHVTLIERDSLSQGGAPRKGVPHGRHAHGLLARGRQALESLFPGIGRELLGLGAIEGDLLAHSVWFNHGVYLRQAECGLMGLLLSRPLLEAHVRSRLMQYANVQFASDRRVTGLIFDKEAAAVTGVRFEWQHVTESLGADLVIDATGRGSRSAGWLTSLGYAPPEEECIEVGICYTTRTYRRHSGQLGGNNVVAVRGGTPDYRFGAALAQEEERWIVTLGGYFGDAAPADEDGFAAFARSLPAPELHAVIDGAEPLSPFSQFRFPASIRRHYERFERFPASYLVFADALCSFNPAYGQGMAAALLEAEALADCLSSGTEGLAQRFFARASAILDTPWQIAVGSDLENPRVAGTRTLFGKFFCWYIGKLHQAGANDISLATRFIKVINLMAPPAALLRPATAFSILIGNLLPASRRRSIAERQWQPI